MSVTVVGQKRKFDVVSSQIRSAISIDGTGAIQGIGTGVGTFISNEKLTKANVTATGLAAVDVSARPDTWKPNFDTEVLEGTTYKRTTVNEKTGASRAYSALNSSNKLVTGTTNRTVAQIEGIVGSDGKAKNLDLTSINTGNLDNIPDGTSYTKVTPSEKTTWNAKESGITKSTTAPGSPVTDQLWLDTSSTPYILKRYTGTAWVNASPTSADHIIEGSTNKFFNGKTLDNLGDGSTYKRTTANEKTGASRAYSAINSSNKLTTGTTNRTVAQIEGIVGSDGKAKNLDLTSINTGTLDNVPDGTSYKKVTPSEKTTWNSKESGITKSTTAPASPVTDQLWLDTSATPYILKRYTGTAWVKASPTSADHIIEGSTNKFFNGKTLDNLGDGTTYKRVTANEKTGAARGYSALNTSNQVVTGLVSTATIDGTAASTVKANAANGAAAKTTIDSKEATWDTVTGKTSKNLSDIDTSGQSVIDGRADGRISAKVTDGTLETPTGAQSKVDGRLSTTEKTNLAANKTLDGLATLYHTSNKPSKSDVGLGNVDNQSATTIRSGITVDTNGAIQGIGTGVGTVVSNSKLTKANVTATGLAAADVGARASTWKPNLDSEVLDGTTYKRVSTTEKNTWNAKESGITKSATAPLSPVTDQLWLDTSATPSILKRYSGTAWVNASPTSADHISEGSTNKFFNGKTLDNLGDGTTYKRTTANEKTGASRAYSAINSSNRLTTGTTNRTVANIEGAVGTDSRAKNLDLASIANGNLDNIGDGATYKKVSATEKTTWNAKEKGIAKQSTAPTSPATDDLWLDTSTTPCVLKRWSGTAWIKATPTSADEISEGSTNKFFSGKTLDNLPDGTNYKRTTLNEKTGASRAYSAINSSNRLTTGTTNRTVANLESAVGSDGRAKNVDLASIANGNLDNIGDGTTYKKVTASEKTGASLAYDAIDGISKYIKTGIATTAKIDGEDASVVKANATAGAAAKTTVDAKEATWDSVVYKVAMDADNSLGDNTILRGGLITTRSVDAEEGIDLDGRSAQKVLRFRTATGNEGATLRLSGNIVYFILGYGTTVDKYEWRSRENDVLMRLNDNNSVPRLEIIGSAKIGNVVYPITDGSANQFLMTNGAGTASWVSAIRADLATNVTANTEWQDGKQVCLGNSSDLRLWHSSGQNYIRSYYHGGHIYIQGENSGGANYTFIDVDPANDRVLLRNPKDISGNALALASHSHTVPQLNQLSEYYYDSQTTDFTTSSTTYASKSFQTLSDGVYLMIGSARISSSTTDTEGYLKWRLSALGDIGAFIRHTGTAGKYNTVMMTFTVNTYGAQDTLYYYYKRTAGTGTVTMGNVNTLIFKIGNV